MIKYCPNCKEQVIKTGPKVDELVESDGDRIEVQCPRCKRVFKIRELPE